jgi:hypothetical protein
MRAAVEHSLIDSNLRLATRIIKNEFSFRETLFLIIFPPLHLDRWRAEAFDSLAKR